LYSLDHPLWVHFYFKLNLNLTLLPIIPTDWARIIIPILVLILILVKVIQRLKKWREGKKRWTNEYN
jgi:hypothetical protein